MPLFAPMHLDDSAAFIRGLVEGVHDPQAGFVQGLGEISEADAGLLAVDIAAYAWLDDCFDALPDRDPIRWEQVVLDEPNEVPGTTVEVVGFHRLRRLFDARPSDPGAVRLWLDTGVEFLALQERDWQAARSLRSSPAWTYAEYLVEAEVNSSIKHLMSTLSLLYDLDMHLRMDDANFRDYMRCVGVVSRLLNDLASIHKERFEEAPRNVLLMLEKYMPPSAAMEFVQRDVAGYERLLERSLRCVDADDPLVRIGRLMLASIKKIYSGSRGRYAKAQ